MLERLAQRWYDTLSRRDVAAIVGMWHDDAVFEFPGSTPMSGRFVGKRAIEAWWRRWADRYASFHFTVTHAAVASVIPGRTATIIAWEADGTTTDGLSLHASGVSFAQMRGLKIAFARDYFFDPTVLERVWGCVPEETVDQHVGDVVVSV